MSALGNYCDRKPCNKMENVLDLKPSIGALKYQLSKCPSFVKMRSSDNCSTICPPEPLVKKPVKEPEPEPEPEPELELRKIVPKYKPSGEWKKQKYEIRLRIHKCPGDPGSLNPYLPIRKEVNCGTKFRNTRF